MPRIRIHADFAADLEEKLAWIAEHRDASWIDGLETGIAEAIALVESAPSVGVESGREHGYVLRKLILRQLPFVVWYAHEERVAASGTIWFLRLFHARQDQPSKRRSRR